MMFNKALSQEQLKALMAPLNGNRVAKRRQGGRELSFLEAWDVKAALIRVFGFGNFSADVLQTGIVRMEQDVPAYSGSGDNRKRKMDDEGNPAFNWSVTAMVTLRLSIHATGATYTESAVASQTGPDVGEVSDFAVKTAESDALKRAAIYLGTQFGLGLYDNGGLGDVVRVLLDPDQKDTLAGADKGEDKHDPVGDARAAAEAIRKGAGGRVVETDSGTWSGKDEYSPAEEGGNQ